MKEPTKRKITRLGRNSPERRLDHNMTPEIYLWRSVIARALADLARMDESPHCELHYQQAKEFFGTHGTRGLRLICDVSDLDWRYILRMSKKILAREKEKSL